MPYHGAYLLGDFFVESAGGEYVGFVHGLVVLVSLFGSPWGWVSCSKPGVKSVTRYKLSDPAWSCGHFRNKTETFEN